MASDASFVEYVVDQMSDAGHITSRPMFGEYAIYCDAKVVALVCDNQLFVKPTAAGRAELETVVEAPPYPGAKPYFLIEAELEMPPVMVAVIRATARELPAPRPKTSKPKPSKPKPSRAKPSQP